MVGNILKPFERPLVRKAAGYLVVLVNVGLGGITAPSVGEKVFLRYMS